MRSFDKDKSLGSIDEMSNSNECDELVKNINMIGSNLEIENSHERGVSMTPQLQDIRGLRPREILDSQASMDPSDQGYNGLVGCSMAQRFENPLKLSIAATQKKNKAEYMKIFGVPSRNQASLEKD